MDYGHHGTRKKLSEAEEGAEERWSSEGDQRSTRAKLSEAGRRGRPWRPGARRGEELRQDGLGKEISPETKEKLSMAGKKGAAAEPREAKVKGGKRSAEERWGT